MQHNMRDFRVNARPWQEAGGPTIRPDCLYPELKRNSTSWLSGIWAILRGVLAR